MRSDIPKLKVAEVIKLCGEIDDRRRKRLIDDLNAMQADPDAKVAALAQHDRYRNQAIVLMHYAMSVEGAYDIIGRAVRQMESQPSIDELDLDPTTSLLALSCSLIGMNFDELTKVGSSDPRQSSPSPSVETG